MNSRTQKQRFVFARARLVFPCWGGGLHKFKFRLNTTWYLTYLAIFATKRTCFLGKQTLSNYPVTLKIIFQSYEAKRPWLKVRNKLSAYSKKRCKPLNPKWCHCVSAFLSNAHYWHILQTEAGDWWILDYFELSTIYKMPNQNRHSRNA